MADFFISYTSAQSGWAEWIGYVLEEEGYTVIIQAWDFRPGSNFVLEMQRAAAEAKRTVMVLAPEYLQSQFAAPEWASAFAQDPKGLQNTLVPVMVEPCQPPGLLNPIVHIKLVGLDEPTARQRLIDGIKAKRAKPSARPSFPGAASQRPHKPFPGPDRQKSSALSAPAPYMPTIKRPPTDVEKRRFIRDTFETIKDVFEQGLRAMAQQHNSIKQDFELTTATEFRAEIFLNGQSKCSSRIWQGAMHSTDSIGYAEGWIPTGGCHEILSFSDNRDGLHISALMASG